MKNAREIVTATATVLLLSACAGEEGTDADRTRAPAESGDGMAGMDGMHDMDGMADMDGGTAGMMGAMHTHMEMMGGMSGDSMRTMLPTHRQMMANMIAQMNREMSDMDMPADAAWSAVMDSLRTDLATMADMDAAELRALMPDHHRRAMRMMDMHREMMAGMQM